MIFSVTELQAEIKGRQGVLLMEHSAFLIVCGFWGVSLLVHGFQLHFSNIPSCHRSESNPHTPVDHCR